MTATRTAHFYLDFVSPYSWLALMQAERFAAEHRVRWEVRPVVYAAPLQANGLIGPVEAAAKRRYTLRDVVRCAHELGLRLKGPPEHPFRSLEALRTAYLFRQEPQGLQLAVRLSDACWGEGRRLSDPAVLVEIVSDMGLDASRLAQRIADPAVKRGLRDLTDEALSRGIFGVPTFVVDGELFWGHDRMDHVARHLAGAGPPSSGLTEKMLARAQGVVRQTVRPRSS